MLLNVNQELDASELNAQLKSIYNTVYRDHGYHPRNSQFSWHIILNVFEKFNEALDVGCGIGYGMAAARMKNQKVFGCDIANLSHYWKALNIDRYCRVAPAHHLPYKAGRFDLMAYNDILEHIPEKLIEKTFDEMYRVGSNFYYMHVHSEPETSLGNLTAQGIFDPHVLIKDQSWWIDLIEYHKLRIVDLHYPFGTDFNIFMLVAVKDTGAGGRICKIKQFLNEEKNKEKANEWRKERGAA